MSTSSTAEPRDVLRERLVADLLGPGSEHEEIVERPTDRYLTGILFPPRADVPPDEDETLGAGESDEADDAPAPMTGAMRPSTCGVSFAVTREEGATASINVEVTCAEYKQFHVDPATGLESSKPEHTKRANERWRRVPLRAALQLNLDQDQSAPVALTGAHVDGSVEGADLFVRTSRAPRSIIVTLALVNRRLGGDTRVESELSSLFQTCIKVTAAEPTRLTARPAKSGGIDRDARVSALIYRSVRENAVGHTCSATWGPSDGAPEWVATDWTPSVVVKRMKAEGDAAFDVLRKHPTNSPLRAAWMAREATDAELMTSLRSVVDAYGLFLDQQDARVSSLGAELQSSARENLKDCRVAAQRMLTSVQLIESDSAVRQAWRLAAGAMALQFSWTKNKELMWHPFQIGFQLLCLSSLADRRAPDRETMDLLWFPTGGGKTEAYLALTAFLFFYRRLARGADAGAGTSVLMRYTLRLLTVQQFQRAAALTLACEAVRRGHENVTHAATPTLGPIPFSIGLWVGKDTTPNRYADAVAALESGGQSTPRQLVQCPRCESALHYMPECERQPESG